MALRYSKKARRQEPDRSRSRFGHSRIPNPMTETGRIRKSVADRGIRRALLNGLNPEAYLVHVLGPHRRSPHQSAWRAPARAVAAELSSLDSPPARYCGYADSNRPTPSRTVLTGRLPSSHVGGVFSVSRIVKCPSQKIKCRTASSSILLCKPP